MNISGRKESLPKLVLTNLPDTQSIADFLEFAFDAVVTFDARWRITYWNPAAEQMYGWTAQEALGKTPADLFWPVNTPEEQNRVRERKSSLEEGATLWGEYNCCRKDASSLWVQYAVRALFDKDEVITGYLALYRDISLQAQLHEKEEQLKQTNQRLNEILASIQDDFYVLDRDWNFVYASRLFTSKVGKEPEAFVGKNIWQMFPKHLGTALEENFRTAMEKGEVRNFEIPGKYTNAWYRMKVFPSAEGITVLGTDITESKRVEEALRVSQLRYRTVAENTQDFESWISPEGRYLYASPSCKQIYGRDATEFLTNPALRRQSVHPDDQATFDEHLVQEAARKTSETEFRIVRSDGTLRWISHMCQPVFDESGNYLGVRASNRDITERKKMEEALRESEERYRYLVKHAPAAIYEIDVQTGHFIEVNDTMCQMLGYTRQELLGMMPEELLDEQSRVRFRERILKTLAGEKVSEQVEYKVRAKDGHDIWTVLNTTINYDRGQPRSASVIAYDITERKRREELSHALNVVNDSIHSTINPHEVMQRAMDQAAEALGCDTAAISLQEGNTWVIRYVHGLPPDLIGMQMHDDEERHAVLAVKTKLPVAVNDALNDERFNREHLRKWGIRSVLVVPLIIRDEARGVIFFNYQQSQNIFADYQIDFAVKFSASLSLALENARLLDDLQGELAQRRHTEQQLRELAQRLTYHVDNSPLAVIEWGSDMRLIRWSSAAERMFGWRAEEVLGKRIEDFRWVYEEDTEQVNNVSVDLQTGREPLSFSANRNYRKDGSVAYCEWYNSSLVDESGNLRSILSLVLDVTERKRAEDARYESEKQLQSLNETLEQKVKEKTSEVRRLASDLVKAEQRERSRISHILHDDLQQRIYALQIELTFFRDALCPDNEAAHNKVSEIEKQMGEIRQIIRHLSIELSPPILPEEGLSHALSWLAAHMQQQHGLPIEVEAEGPFALSDEQTHVLLFNCVRELLFNVVKHGQASRAVVSLQWSDDDLRIEVRDNGKGFTVNKGSEEISAKDELPSSFGLPTIRHQLNLFGGSMEIYSEPGAGTQVILRVPTKQAA